MQNKTSKRGMGIDMGAWETNDEDAGEVEEGSGGKGAEGAKATPWEAAAKGCCRVKSDILAEEPETPKRFGPASKNHWNPRQFISASDPLGFEQCALGCPSGTPVLVWGKEVRNKARENQPKEDAGRSQGQWPKDAHYIEHWNSLHPQAHQSG